MVGQGLVDALIGAAQAEPAAADQPVDDEVAEQDRGDEEQQEAAEQRQHEDESGVAVAESGGEALGVSTGARREYRDRTARRFPAAVVGAGVVRDCWPIVTTTPYFPIGDFLSPGSGVAHAASRAPSTRCRFSCS